MMCHRHCELCEAIQCHGPKILILSPSKEELQRMRISSSSFDGLRMRMRGVAKIDCFAALARTGGGAW
jgi:hypothetical protein